MKQDMISSSALVLQTLQLALVDAERRWRGLRVDLLTSNVLFSRVALHGLRRAGEHIALV